jgi:hypothetical protein
MKRANEISIPFHLCLVRQVGAARTSGGEKGSAGPFGWHSSPLIASKSLAKMVEETFPIALRLVEDFFLLSFLPTRSRVRRGKKTNMALVLPREGKFHPEKFCALCLWEENWSGACVGLAFVMNYAFLEVSGLSPGAETRPGVNNGKIDENFHPKKCSSRRRNKTHKKSCSSRRRVIRRKIFYRFHLFAFNHLPCQRQTRWTTRWGNSIPNCYGKTLRNEDKFNNFSLLLPWSALDVEHATRSRLVMDHLDGKK